MKNHLNRLLIVAGALVVLAGVGCEKKDTLEKAGAKVDAVAQKTGAAIWDAAYKTTDAAKETAEKAKTATDNATQ